MLELQSSDLTIPIKHQIAANVEEEGEIVVSWKRLSKTLLKTFLMLQLLFLKVENVHFVTCQRSSFRLNTLSAHDWAQFPEFNLEKT